MSQPTSSGSKLRKHPLPLLQHSHFAPARAAMCENLRRDVASADHDDPLGQILKLHECIAGNGVLRTGKVERDRRMRQRQCSDLDGP